MPALFANVPEGIVWGRVTAYVTGFVADGGTELPDGTRDAVPLEGTITLTPTVGVMAFPTLAPPQQAVIQSLACPIIGGVLYAPGTTPENVGDRDPGVILVASEQPLGLPDRVQYKVTWALKCARVSPPSVTIDVPSQATVDLATVIPATPGPGVVVVVSTEDRERAEVAANLAEGFAGDAETARDQAVTAKAAAETAADAAETAADAAETAAGSALAARGDAERFAGHAEASAGEAADSAGEAAGSADVAAGYRDQAQDYAGQASGYATGAQTAAGAAAGSAGDAATSATDAGLSAASAAAAISSTSWSGSVSLTPTPGGLIHATLTGDTTLTLPDLDPTVAVSVNLLVTQDATGGHKLTVPFAKAAYGVMPDVTGSAGASDVWTLLWDGTDWTVFVGAQNLLIPMGWVI